ncbi:MAG: hypothetical protein IJV46_06835 [Acidaminococcaceae bacterium]|nr:hypothetical protein [Acidaminococcaceae bacterium]
MSVPAWKRKSNDLNVAIAAETLLNYTMQKMQGTKGRAYFTKSVTFTKRIPLLKATTAVLHNIMAANEFQIDDDLEYEMRHEKQLKALAAVSDVVRYLTTFNDDKKIDSLEHWIGLVDDVLRLLKAWIKSDKERRFRLLQQRAIRLAKLETEIQGLKSMPFGVVENNTITARNQWLRSPNPGNANNVRIVNTSGAVNNNNANNSNAVAPDCMDSQTK